MYVCCAASQLGGWPAAGGHRLLRCRRVHVLQRPPGLGLLAARLWLQRCRLPVCPRQCYMRGNCPLAQSSRRRASTASRPKQPARAATTPIISPLRSSSRLSSWGT